MDRIGAPPADAPIAQQTEARFDPLNFVAPTEFVELPSRGKGYPSGHPLFDQETIEIRYMTAKDEDILSSPTLLKKGLAIERFIENVITDKRIKASEMLVGDRNAVIIASRISGYGADYEAKVTCPACSSVSKFDFDLNDQKVHQTELSEELNLTASDDGLFATLMPYSKFNIKFRLLKGKDETYLAKLMSNKKRTKMADSLLTDQMKRMIVSIEGHTDASIIDRYVNNMPTIDSRHLRVCYKMANPDVKITNLFVCSSCNFEEGMEVPFGADFFWPDR